MLRWTLELDTVLCDSIVDGKAWQEIAAGLHLSRDQVARRASRLGLKRGMSFKDGARRAKTEQGASAHGIGAATSISAKSRNLWRGIP